MAGKDLATYSGSAPAVTNTAVTVPLSGTVEEDSGGFTRTGDEVTQQDDGAVLIRHVSGYVYDGSTAYVEVRVALQVSPAAGGGWQDVPGGQAYGGFSNLNGVDRCWPGATTLVDGKAGDKYRLRAETLGAAPFFSGDTANGIADSVRLSLLQIPSAFPVAILTDTGGNRAIGTSYDLLQWNSTVRLDAGFTLVGTSPKWRIQADAGGRVLYVVNRPMFVDDTPHAITEGCVFHTKLVRNGSTDELGTQRRKAVPHKGYDGASINPCTFWPIDLAAGQDIGVQTRRINWGDAGEEFYAINGEGVFAAILVDDTTPDAFDAFHLRHNASTSGAGGTDDIPFAITEELDSGSFTRDPDDVHVTFPSAKVLTGANLPLWITAGGAEHAGFYACLFDGTSELPHSRDGGGLNLNDPPATPKQHQTGMELGAWFTATGQVLNVRTVEIGTLDAPSTQLDGGNSLSSRRWWAFNISQWPDDPVPYVDVEAIARSGLLGVASATRIAAAAGTARSAAVGALAQLGRLANAQGTATTSSLASGTLGRLANIAGTARSAAVGSGALGRLANATAVARSGTYGPGRLSLLVPRPVRVACAITRLAARTACAARQAQVSAQVVRQVPAQATVARTTPVDCSVSRQVRAEVTLP